MITEPEYHQHEEFRNRSQKLQELREGGIDPYPHHFSPSATAGDLNAQFEGKEVGHSEDAEHAKTERVIVAGRLILFRAMGKNAFAHLQDETGRIQIMFNRDATQVEGFTPTAELNALKFLRKEDRPRRYPRRRGTPFPHPKGRAHRLR